MNFYEAIKILGLSEKFTEDDLKKAYRQKANLYHPDRFASKPVNEQGSAEEKMKKINSAHDCLKKHLKDKTGNVSLEDYKRNLIYELNKIIEFNESIKELFLNTHIQKIISYVAQFKNSLISRDSKDEVDNAYQNILELIHEQLEKFKKEFYSANFISDDDVKESINYNCTLLEFYKQLVANKNKYSKKLKFEEKLKEETDKYTSYAGYDQIKYLIFCCETDALEKAKEQKYQDTKEILKNMHKEIENCFNEYHVQNKKILEMSNWIENIDDETIKSSYKKLQEDFNNVRSLSDTKTKIENLEELIKQYLNKKNEENIEKINKFYQKLKMKAADFLFNINGDGAKIYHLMNTVYTINEFFRQCSLGKIDIDELKCLEEITFEDVEIDNKIMEALNKKCNTVQNTNIYFRKSIRMYADMDSFYYLKKDDGKNYLYSFDNKDGFTGNFKEITDFEMLQKDYISFEEVFESAQYIGKAMNLLTPKILLYWNGDYAVIYDARLKRYQLLNHSAIAQPNNSASIDYSYADKNQLKKNLVSQLEKSIEDYYAKENSHNNTYRRLLGIFSNSGCG